MHYSGFSEDRGSTFEDYEFFINAVLKGYSLQLVPEALLWYRQNSKTHLMKDTNGFLNRMRALRPYLHSLPPQWRVMLQFAYGAARGLKEETAA